MENIKSFFSQTFYFWIILRVVIIFLFIGSLIKDRHEQFQFKTLRAFLVYIPFQLYIVALVILFIQFGLKTKRNLIIQVLAGIYSIYYSIIVSIDLSEQNQKIYFQVLPLLLFVFGIWQMFFDKDEMNAFKNRAL